MVREGDGRASEAGEEVADEVELEEGVEEEERGGEGGEEVVGERDEAEGAEEEGVGVGGAIHGDGGEREGDARWEGEERVWAVIYGGGERERERGIYVTSALNECGAHFGWHQAHGCGIGGCRWGDIGK